MKLLSLQEEAAKNIAASYMKLDFRLIRVENNRCYAVFKGNRAVFKFEVYLTTHLKNNFYMCQIQNWFDTDYQAEKNLITDTIEGVNQFLVRSVKHINSLP